MTEAYATLRGLSEEHLRGDFIDGTVGTDTCLLGLEPKTERGREGTTSKATQHIHEGKYDPYARM